MSELETRWTTIIEKALKHPSNMVTGAHGSTLHSMKSKGMVYRSSLGDWFLTDEAVEREAKKTSSSEEPTTAEETDDDPFDEEDFDPVVHFETLALWYEAWLERKAEFDNTPALKAKQSLVAEWRHWYDLTTKRPTQVASNYRYTTERCLALIMEGDRPEFVRGWEKYWDEVLTNTARFPS